MLPFVNNLWTATLTGAQFKTLLEQQWQTDADGTCRLAAVPAARVCRTTSATPTTPPRPQGAHITSITVDGAPLDPAARYRIGTFSFLATGGDNFRIFTRARMSRTPG